MAELKPKPNHREFLESLSRLGGEQRLMRSFQSSQRARQQLKDAIVRARPGLGDAEVHQLFLDQLGKWQNKNY